MGQLVLYKGQVIQVKVTQITPCAKTFNTKEGSKCRHDITIEDTKGNKATCEYITPVGEEPTAFVLGVLQYIEAKWVTAQGTEILPSEPPGEKGNTPTSGARERAYAPTGGNDRTISFAFSYAKDLMVAEIAANPGKQITDEHIERMIRYGKRINNAMIDNAPQA